MATANKNIVIIATKASNLPIAPVEYSQQYQDQLNNVMTKYFATVDNFTQAIVVPLAGVSTHRPDANLLIGQSFFDTTLGLPIWWNGANWIDATGTVV